MAKKTTVLHNATADNGFEYVERVNWHARAIELESLLIGVKLGEGASRAVYRDGRDDRYVVKHEYLGSYQNVIEFETWHRSENFPEMRKWLAPCYALSVQGRFLVQAFCCPIPADKMPKKIPAFLSDVKHTNFGFHEGRIVCFDYGTVLSQLVHSTKLVPVRKR